PGTAPQLLAGLLYVGSGGGLLLFRLGRRHARDAAETPLGRPDLPWLAGAILAGGVVAPLLLMLGLTRSHASAASLLLNLEGVSPRASPGCSSVSTSTRGSRSACWPSSR